MLVVAAALLRVVAVGGAGRALRTVGAALAQELGALIHHAWHGGWLAGCRVGEGWGGLLNMEARCVGELGAASSALARKASQHPPDATAAAASWRAYPCAGSEIAAASRSLLVVV
ncbi:hypothetical protein FKM82_030371 [Ascaphus truei]